VLNFLVGGQNGQQARHRHGHGGVNAGGAVQPRPPNHGVPLGPNPPDGGAPIGGSG
jgi:hypothetical protein